MERLIARLGFRQLRMLVAISNAGNLVGAAKELNMTQSAVTKALQETEAVLGVHLFDRTNRGVIPTIFGHALLAHTGLILAQLSHAAEELRDLRDGLGGRIALGTLLAASAELLPRSVASLRQERPNVIVSIREGTNDLLIPALMTGELDFVVGRLSDALGKQELRQEALLQDVACVVARSGHPLAGRRDLHLSDLGEFDWILPRQDTTLRHELDRAFREEGIDPPAHSVESMSIVTNRYLLRDADYLSVLPWQTAKVECANGDLTILPISLTATIGSLGIITRKSARLSPASERLLEIIRAVATDMTRSPLL